MLRTIRKGTNAVEIIDGFLAIAQFNHSILHTRLAKGIAHEEQIMFGILDEQNRLVHPHRRNVGYAFVCVNAHLRAIKLSSSLGCSALLLLTNVSH